MASPAFNYDAWLNDEPAYEDECPMDCDCPECDPDLYMEQNVEQNDA